MSVQNGERLVTKQDLADFYNDIRPYMGGLVSSKAGFTPIGTIISVMGTTAPANYLACDGTVYNIADYTELANYFNSQFGSKNFFGGDGTTTFAVPDLRGEFLRGTGTNSHTNQGSGASVGVHQDATILPQFYSNSANLVYSIQKGIANFDSEIKDRDDSACDYNATSRGTTNTYSKTIRPTNTSVLFCIATKNIYLDPTLEYSTEEKIVGTWIDGKPIYQKTITGLSLTMTWNGQYHTRATIPQFPIDKSLISTIISASGITTSGCVPLAVNKDASIFLANDQFTINSVTWCYTKTT